MNITRLNILFILSGLLVLFTSCQKVIDIDVNRAAEQLVIEGNITNIFGSQYIKISRSVPYTDSNSYPPVSGAKVRVSDNAGNSYNFSETKSGLYSSGSIQGIAGRTYTLQVETNGTIYSGMSTMPKAVNLDSLSITKIDFAGDERRVVTVNYSDPADVVNQYRFILFVNGVQSKRVYADDDRLTNGRNLQTQLFQQQDDDDDEKLKQGDVIRVEMQCIDKNIFTYWYSLSQQSGNGPGGGITPGNPPSNLTNNALGYFSAHTTQVRRATVK